MKVLPQHHNHNHKYHICGAVIPHHTTNDYTFVVLWYSESYKVVKQVKSFLSSLKRAVFCANRKPAEKYTNEAEDE